MKKTTRKLTGHAKDRFFARFFAEEPGLSAETAQSLARRSSATFTSVRIKRIAWGLLQGRRDGRGKATSDVAPPSSVATASVVQPVAEVVAVPAIPAGAIPGEPVAFDPYVFGLVPVFQREGRDGLMAKLATVDHADNLRLMAKTQQVVLPAELRKGDADAATLRTAIADAVAKRVADRRAAAG